MYLKKEGVLALADKGVGNRIGCIVIKWGGFALQLQKGVTA